LVPRRARAETNSAMSDAFDEIAERRGDDGARRFARWDLALYRALCQGPAKRLGRRLKAKPFGAALLDAYLALAGDAIGLGYVDQEGYDALTKEGRAAANLIALLWIKKLPERRFEGDPEQQIDLFAKAFNVGEGLLGEPGWLNRYVAASLHDLAELDGFEA